jgi:hypothetical protein
MNEDEYLEELKWIIRDVVSMYRALWDEVARQFPETTTEERGRILTLISPLINNMFLTAITESAAEEVSATTNKDKKKHK